MFPNADLSPAVFLDRDGTIIEDRGHLRDPGDAVFLPETFDALFRLQEEFRLFIVTHQPGVAGGLLSLGDVELVNRSVVERLAARGIEIAGVFVCPHTRSEGCRCIKPGTFFPEKAAEEFGIDLSRSFAVGDHPHDVEMARNFGGRGVYVLTGHGAKHRPELPPDTLVAPDIGSAARLILSFWVRGGALRPNPSGDRPLVASSAFVDPSARLIGKVRVGPGAYIGPNAVVRADETGGRGPVAPVEIGAECNVQDGVVIHALAGTGVRIGPRTSIAHGAVVHGPCEVGSGCFVGFRAVLFDVELEEGAYVGAGAVVRGVRVPSRRLVPDGAVLRSSEDAASLGETGPAERDLMEKVVRENLRLAAGYAGVEAERLSAGYPLAGGGGGW